MVCVAGRGVSPGVPHPGTTRRALDADRGAGPPAVPHPGRQRRSLRPRRAPRRRPAGAGPRLLPRRQGRPASPRRRGAAVADRVRRGGVAHDPELVRTFVRANADRLDASSRAILEAADRDGAARLLTALPPDLQQYLDALSPLRVARDIRARLVLVHGRADRAVPYTESLRLAAARPERTTLVLVGVVEHVEGRGASGWRGARGFLALWRGMAAPRATPPQFLVPA